MDDQARYCARNLDKDGDKIPTRQKSNL